MTKQKPLTHSSLEEKRHKDIVKLTKEQIQIQKNQNQFNFLIVIGMLITSFYYIWTIFMSVMEKDYFSKALNLSLSKDEIFYLIANFGFMILMLILIYLLTKYINKISKKIEN